jgi:hypothetical protein
MALDQGNVSVLTLLDLSAAFDTVDHTILLTTLLNQYGICGTALSWFRDYLANRTQSVVINNSSSDNVDLVFGVPQGSVLGPVLFVMYSRPLSTLIDSHAVLNQAFADDTQLYGSSPPSEVNSTITNMQHCISDVRTWMADHKLKLNDDKTEALLIHSGRSFSKVDKPTSIRVGHADISFSPQARNLGYFITDTMTLDVYVSHICRSAYTALRQISSIRSFLTVEATKKLVCALVLSRLDYANSTLAGCSKQSIAKLQKVQNSAARLILRTRKREHVTPLLRELHWLPIQARIDYKLSMICHAFFQGSAPQYISDIFTAYQPARQLRSSSDHRTLCVPKTRTKLFGERAFSFAGPKQWNSLPVDIRHLDSHFSFKKALKTHLFRLYL